MTSAEPIPLPLPEKIFSEEDIELVALAITNASGGVYNNTDGWARYVLEALAATGRLLPPDAEHREEWGCLVTEPHPRRREQVGDVIKLTEEQARYGLQVHSGWTTVKRAIVPWTEVDGSTSDEH